MTSLKTILTGGETTGLGLPEISLVKRQLARARLDNAAHVFCAMTAEYHHGGVLPGGEVASFNRAHPEVLGDAPEPPRRSALTSFNPSRNSAMSGNVADYDFSACHHQPTAIIGAINGRPDSPFAMLRVTIPGGATKMVKAIKKNQAQSVAPAASVAPIASPESASETTTQADDMLPLLVKAATNTNRLRSDTNRAWHAMFHAKGEAACLAAINPLLAAHPFPASATLGGQVAHIRGLIEKHLAPKAELDRPAQVPTGAKSSVQQLIAEGKFADAYASLSRAERIGQRALDSGMAQISAEAAKNASPQDAKAVAAENAFEKYAARGRARISYGNGNYDGRIRGH